MIKIIDNKKVEMTSEEHQYYKKICASYNRENFDGEDMFKDHFSSNDHGYILFVHPPNNSYSSLEVYCFLISLQVNQHLRNIQKQMATMVKEAEGKMKVLFEKQSSSGDSE